MAQRGRKSPDKLASELRAMVSDRTLPPPVPPPAHLSSKSKAYWNRVVRRYHLDASELQVLEHACDSLDLVIRSRETLAAQDLMVPGPHGPKPHPAVAISRDARVSFLRHVRALHLTGAEPDKRPSLGGYGVTHEHDLENQREQ